MESKPQGPNRSTWAWDEFERPLRLVRPPAAVSLPRPTTLRRQLKLGELEAEGGQERSLAVLSFISAFPAAETLLATKPSPSPPHLAHAKPSEEVEIELEALGFVNALPSGVEAKSLAGAASERLLKRAQQLEAEIEALGAVAVLPEPEGGQTARTRPTTSSADDETDREEQDAAERAGTLSGLVDDDEAIMSASDWEQLVDVEMVAALSFVNTLPVQQRPLDTRITRTDPEPFSVSPSTISI